MNEDEIKISITEGESSEMIEKLEEIIKRETLTSNQPDHAKIIEQTPTKAKSRHPVPKRKGDPGEHPLHPDGE